MRHFDRPEDGPSAVFLQVPSSFSAASGPPQLASAGLRTCQSRAQVGSSAAPGGSTRSIGTASRPPRHQRESLMRPSGPTFAPSKGLYAFMLAAGR